MFFDGEECAGVVILLSELSLCVTFKMAEHFVTVLLWIILFLQKYLEGF